LKIIDFGTAIEFKPGVKLTERIGTPYYIAPEILNQKYDEACDLWSCGVIIFILLTGRPPFNGENDEEILEKVRKGKIDFNDYNLNKISSDGVDLLKRLLCYNPANRINSLDALNHAWIKKRKNSTLDHFSYKKIFSGIKKFNAKEQLSQVTLTYLVNQLLTKEETLQIRKLFQKLDENHDGVLSYEELVKGYKHISCSNQPEKDAKEIFDKLDQDGSGSISYEEFIRAAIDKNKIFTDSRIKQAFKLFDKDNSGSIDATEIKKVLSQTGEVSDEIIQEIIKEVDINGDGFISQEEFKITIKKL